MRRCVACAVLALLLLEMGCGPAPVSVQYPDLSQQRFTRVNFRNDGNTLYSSNFLGLANAHAAGSPAVVTMFSAQEVRLTIHGAAYTMRPLGFDLFNTDQQSISNFLDKYFVSDQSELNLDALGPAEQKGQVLSGNYAIGMTKGQVFTALGPPVFINKDLPTGNLPRAQIMAADRWTYPQSQITFVTTYIELVFYESKLQEVIQ